MGKKGKPVLMVYNYEGEDSHIVKAFALNPAGEGKSKRLAFVDFDASKEYVIRIAYINDMEKWRVDMVHNLCLDHDWTIKKKINKRNIK